MSARWSALDVDERRVLLSGAGLVLSLVLVVVGLNVGSVVTVLAWGILAVVCFVYLERASRRVGGGS